MTCEIPELDDERWETYTRAVLDMLRPDEYVAALVALSIMLRAWQIENGLWPKP